MQTPQPSHPSLTGLDPEARVAALEARMASQEERMSGTGGPEPSMTERLEELQRGRDADGRTLTNLVDAVGKSPDAATGEGGSGMRKQLAALVEAAKKPTVASYFAAGGTALLAIYQILKGFGIVH